MCSVAQMPVGLPVCECGRGTGPVNSSRVGTDGRGGSGGTHQALVGRRDDKQDALLLGGGHGEVKGGVLGGV